jgi:hemerythrin-like domain-containing protein
VIDEVITMAATTAQQDQPADTRMMGIVHEALKRDLRRARDVIAGDRPPGDRQREALGRHLGWMMDFLHGHHTGEDDGLWPAVRQRNPGAGPLLDSLEADHARIAPAAAELTAAATAYTASSSPAARTRIVAALDALADVLFPHLDREVAEAMPVVAATLTNAEWEDIEERHNLDGKSTRELATEGHWLIEGIDPEGYDVVVHKVPPVLRFVLVHGFGAGYRRQARRRWTPQT